MDEPFGDRPTVNFTYRLSERFRRVYEQDAMGHLLVAHFFDSLLSNGKPGRLIGLHTGMEVRSVDTSEVAGEADVLLLTQHGEFIPVEVKRRSSGLTNNEISKLNDLASALSSPWSAVAVCEYAQTAELDLDELVDWKNVDGTYRRMVLTYDQLLNPMLIWALGDDPFSLNTLAADEIIEREKRFVDSLARRSIEGPESFFEYELLNPHNSSTAPS